MLRVLFLSMWRRSGSRIARNFRDTMPTGNIMRHTIRDAAQHFVLAGVLLCVCPVWHVRAQAAQQDSRGQTAAQAVEEANSLRRSGQPGWGDRLRAAAMRLAREGRFLAAVRVLEPVVMEPENAFEALSASRMQGQYYRAAGMTSEAMEAFEAHLEIARENPALVQRMPASFISASVQYSSLLKAEGRERESLVVNEGILGLGRDVAGDTAYSGALARRAQLLEASGDPEGALVVLDRLLETFPEYGRADGRRIFVLLSRARLRHPDREGFEYAIELERIWSDIDLGDSVHALPVGLELMQVWDACGQPEDALLQARDVLARIDRHRARPAQQGRGPKSVVDATELTVLSRMQSADPAEHPELAMLAIERLRSRAKSEADARSLDIQEARLRPRPEESE